MRIPYNCDLQPCNKELIPHTLSVENGRSDGRYDCIFLNISECVPDGIGTERIPEGSYDSKKGKTSLMVLKEPRKQQNQ